MNSYVKAPIYKKKLNERVNPEELIEDPNIPDYYSKDRLERKKGKIEH
ncbi:MAG: hypothetical protein ACFFBD_27025 [Candidatus Hodarchaeota archaeon]